MIEHLLSAGDRLLVRFVRRADRWEHAIELRRDEGSALPWHSEEGMVANESWPPSPPFQNLEMHDEPDGRRFALLVGMAGASHWSASVEADSARERIVFDVACRVKTKPEWLGSSYVGGQADRLKLQAIAPPADFGPQPIIETIDDRIIIRVADSTGPLPRTIRWKYAIQAGDRA